MQIRRTRLADGRALLFFDAAHRPDPRRDRRELGAHRPRPELRRDVLTGEWVAVAAHRMARTLDPARVDCPLCPTRAGAAPTEIPDGDYDVAVFENRFPAYPHCEVVCFSPDHDQDTTRLDPAHLRLVVEAWAQRTAELSGRPDVAQVSCFENRGAEIGVTLSHPHGQIYGSPFVPPRTAQLLGQSAGRDLLGELLAEEVRARVRIVYAGAHWTAFVPPAARWPAELRLVPHRRVPDLAALDDAERAELATTYPELLRRIDGLHPGPAPAVAIWHQAPVREGRDAVRLSLQLFTVRRAPGVLKYLAASESGAGAWLVDTVPEDVAARLREVPG